MPAELPADLRSHPFVRGFWTDDEMFEATGATSLGLIKAMQREKLIAPGKYKNPNGKLSRAWGAGDLFRIALAVDVADETGFSLLVATKILSAIGPEKIDHVLSTQKTLEALERRRDEALTRSGQTEIDGLPTDWSGLEFTTDRPKVLDIKIVDRRLVFLLSQADEDPDITNETPLGSLADAKGNFPLLVPAEQLKQPLLYEEERSVLIVRLSCLADRPLRAAFGTTAYPNIWIR